MLPLARLSTLPPVDKLVKPAVADAALSRELDWMALRHPFQSQPLRDSATVVDHLFLSNHLEDLYFLLLSSVL